MNKIEVGFIEEYPVLYLPDKDLIFCKNTVVPVNVMLDAFNSGIDRVEYKEKNLIMYFLKSEITLGCLKTSPENFREIVKTVKRIKRNETRSSRCNVCN